MEGRFVYGTGSGSTLSPPLTTLVQRRKSCVQQNSRFCHLPIDTSRTADFTEGYVQRGMHQCTMDMTDIKHWLMSQGGNKRTKLGMSHQHFLYSIHDSDQGNRDEIDY
ncbi:hypothetical protein J6590_018199 [Homalodisca vitripennis]|nr:hypothetical protein J6590_018199 [Homalodisca vitripennis]